MELCIISSEISRIVKQAGLNSVLFVFLNAFASLDLGLRLKVLSGRTVRFWVKLRQNDSDEEKDG